MKKLFVLSILLLSFASTSLVMAVSDPFSDVPAKHWAYDAVKELADAGLVNGSDGAFRGERTMTRYEMALVVANAMTKADNADAKTKAVLDKLIQEFSDELKGLGKRLSIEVEPKKPIPDAQGPLTINGFMNYRYEYVKNPRPLTEDEGYVSSPSHVGRPTDKGQTRTLIGLNLDNRFDGDTYFHGLLMMETLGGRTTDTDLEVREAFMAKKIGANAELQAGRFVTSVGLGTLGGAPYMDGARLSFGKDVKVNLMSTKFGGEGVIVHYADGSVPTVTTNYPNYTFNSGDIKFNLNKDLKMSLAYLADTDESMYNSKAVGLEYNGIKNIQLSGEYGENSAETAKNANGALNSSYKVVPGDTPKAYFIKAKYKGANPNIPGTSGFWVEYKMADAGFDLMSFSDRFNWSAPFNHTTPACAGQAENIKGFEYGFETTVAKRMTFKVAYNDLKRVSDDSVISLATKKDQSYLIAELGYFF